MIGQTLGAYRVVAKLGAGGMGEVYRARDTTLNRDVALKVLPDGLTNDPDRMMRFEREAQALAALNHPNIAQVYGFERSGDSRAIVMELVGGQTLGEMLASRNSDRESQIRGSRSEIGDLEWALPIARQIAAALEAAHERGIIHRDLKPANIKITDDGVVKVLDFGLAKALDPTATGSGGDAPDSPTVTSPAMTQMGVVLGTAAYMAPEQAKGKPVDKRADVWAFGVVLFEMLSGRRLFAGDGVTEVMARVIEREPDWEALPADLPAPIRRLLRRCLVKDKRDRLPDIIDARLEIDDATGARDDASTVGAVAPGPWNRLSLGLAALAAALAVALVITMARQTEPPAGSVMTFSLPLGQEGDAYLIDRRSVFGRPFVTSLAMSPDGTQLVYSAASTPPSQLYLQRLDQERPTRLAGTEGARHPVFSPDGAWIVFVTRAGLMRYSLADGSVETLSPWEDTLDADLRGLTWADDGTIVGVVGRELVRIQAGGGAPEVLAEVPDGTRLWGPPDVLPGSQVVLFHEAPTADPARTDIVALDLAADTRTTVLSDAMHPIYLDSGHLLFVRMGTLMAVGFDAERLAVHGEPIVLVPDVMHAVYMLNTGQETGVAQVAVSPAGHLAYVRGGVYPGYRETLARVRPNESPQPLDIPPSNFGYLRPSPDGDRLAVTTGPGTSEELWVHDLTRGVAERLNTGAWRAAPMAWSPDGRWLAFSSDSDGNQLNIYRTAADGSGEPERLTTSDRHQSVASWSSQDVIAFVEADDIWVLRPGQAPVPFFTSDAAEHDPMFSPDGRWLAYTSNATGRREVYVRPYPEAEPATRLSLAGGVNPAWSPGGRRVFYVSADISSPVLMAVDLSLDGNVRPERPYPLIDPWPADTKFPVRGYDVFPDGSFVEAVRENQDDEANRFVREMHQFGAQRVHVVLNWVEELKRRVPVR